MLKPIANLPAGIVGFKASGEVTASDYETILIPAVEATLRKTRKRRIRFLYHLGSDFTGFSAGALWQDAELGLRELTAWEKIAVVTDVGWIAVAVKAFQFMLPTHVQVFPNRKLAAAKAWIQS